MDSMQDPTTELNAGFIQRIQLSNPGFNVNIAWKWGMVQSVRRDL